MHVTIEAPGYEIIEGVDLTEEEVEDFHPQILRAITLDKGWISIAAKEGSVIIPNGVLMNSVIRIIK